VAYGSEVLVEDVDEGTQSTYEIVFPEEVDAGQGRISLSSPIGRALLNKEEGDEVEVITPQGRRSYQILGLKTFRERGVTDGKG
jgi:transcription elongation factor GreA